MVLGALFHILLMLVGELHLPLLSIESLTKPTFQTQNDPSKSPSYQKEALCYEEATNK